MKALKRATKDRNEGLIASNEDVAEHLFEDIGLTPTTFENKGIEFFRPDLTFIDWIKDYADGRMIVEIGCGTGLVLRMLSYRGHDALMGIDPVWDVMSETKEALSKGREPLRVLPWEVERHSNILSDMTKKPTVDNEHMAAWTKKGVLLLFCRPCHSDFVENAVDYVQSGTEVMYITKPSVLEEYNDLGKYQDLLKTIKHEGTSKEGEVVSVFVKP